MKEKHPLDNAFRESLKELEINKHPDDWATMKTELKKQGLISTPPKGYGMLTFSALAVLTGLAIYYFILAKELPIKKAKEKQIAQKMELNMDSSRQSLHKIKPGQVNERNKVNKINNILRKEDEPINKEISPVRPSASAKTADQKRTLATVEKKENSIDYHHTFKANETLSHKVPAIHSKKELKKNKAEQHSTIVEEQEAEVSESNVNSFQLQQNPQNFPVTIEKNVAEQDRNKDEVQHDNHTSTNGSSEMIEEANVNPSINKDNIIVEKPEQDQQTLVNSSDSTDEASSMMLKVPPDSIKATTTIIPLLTDSTQKKELKWFNRLVISPYFSMDYNKFRFKANDPFGEWMINSGELDHPAYALQFSTGIRIGYRLSKKWELSTGLLYAQKKNLYLSKSNDLYFHTTTYYEFYTYYVDLPGKYLDIPLSIKYYIPLQKIKCYVNAGGLLHWNSSPGYLFQDISSNYGADQSKGNQNTKLYGVIAGMGIERSFNDKISFYLEPSFKYTLTPLFPFSSSLDYHTYAFALGTGINYKF